MFKQEFKNATFPRSDFETWSNDKVLFVCKIFIENYA